MATPIVAAHSSAANQPPPSIPMAVPISSTASSQPPASAPANKTDDYPDDAIRISKVKKKRRRSTAGLVVLGLMTVAAIGGIVAVILNFDSLLRFGVSMPSKFRPPRASSNGIFRKREARLKR